MTAAKPAASPADRHIRRSNALVATQLSARQAAGSGYEQAKAKLRCIESDEVAVAFGPPT